MTNKPLYFVYTFKILEMLNKNFPNFTYIMS